MNKRLASYIPALGLVAAVAEPADPPPPFLSPNIVLIVLDDPNPLHLGTAGYPIQVTPEIDDLAAKGFVFQNVQTCPRCGPAVAQLLSGRECMATGICWNGNEGPAVVPAQILPRVLKGAPERYHTFGQGKGVVVDSDTAFEFGSHSPMLWRDPLAAAWTQEMEDFFDATGDGLPRFMWVMPTMPHVPWDPPLTVPPGWESQVVVPPGVSAEDRPAFLADELKQLLMTQYTDARLGEFLSMVQLRFVDEQEEGDLRDTWVILVVGDNGWANGRIGKGSPYDPGVRSSVSFTSLKAPRTAARFYELPISTLDVSQTVLRMGRTSDVNYRGLSLFPLLRETQTPLAWVSSTGRRTVFNAAFPNDRSEIGPGCPLATVEQDVYAAYGHHIDAVGQRWKYVIWRREIREEPFEFPGACPQTPPAWLGTDQIGLYHAFVPFGQRAAFSEELYLLDSVLDDGINGDTDPFEQANVGALNPALVQQLRSEAVQWWNSVPRP